MKKVSLLVACFIILGSFSTASAIDWSMIKGGASGYLSSDRPVGVFFYAKQGENVAIANFTNTVAAICAVVSAENSSSMLASGTDVVLFKAPASTLYVSVCLKKSGTTGDAIIGALDADKLSALRKADNQTPLSESEKGELAKAVKGIFEGSE